VKSFEVTLKSGVAVVREDELDELIQTLTDIRRSLPRRIYVGSAHAYVDYDAAKEILQQEFAGDEKHLTRRFGRLWSAIGRFAMNGDIAYDAYCKACGTQLSDHAATACYGMIGNSRNVVVSAQSLRYCTTAFVAKRTPQVGDAVRKDYIYLVDHLPAE
jgi:hypothetical protein